MPAFTYTTIDDPSGTYVTAAYGINDAGQIVGYYQGIDIHSFLYSGGTYTNIDDPDGPNTAHGINSAGQIVGYYLDSSGHPQGFLYNGGTYTNIGDPLG